MNSDRLNTVANSDGFVFPSQIFSDPHYYDGFWIRREIRHKTVCDGFKPILRQILAVAKTEFSSSV